MIIDVIDFDEQLLKKNFFFSIFRVLYKNWLLFRAKRFRRSFKQLKNYSLKYEFLLEIFSLWKNTNKMILVDYNQFRLQFSIFFFILRLIVSNTSIKLFIIDLNFFNVKIKKLLQKWKYAFDIVININVNFSTFWSIINTCVFEFIWLVFKIFFLKTLI